MKNIEWMRSNTSNQEYLTFWIGDFDRHADRWRWAETKTEDKTHIFSPIPRDRVSGFASFDGGIFEFGSFNGKFPKILSNFF